LAYFASEEDRDGFLKEVEELGYSLVSVEKIEDADKPYQLHVIRMDTTEIFDLNQNVWTLVEFVKKFNGNYGGWGCNVV
jgi:conserved uncharacterized cytosolic protein, putative